MSFLELLSVLGTRPVVAADDSHSVESDYVCGELALGSYVTHWLCRRPGHVSGGQHKSEGWERLQEVLNELGGS